MGAMMTSLAALQEWFIQRCFVWRGTVVLIAAPVATWDGGRSWRSRQRADLTSPALTRSSLALLLLFYCFSIIASITLCFCCLQCSARRKCSFFFVCLFVWVGCMNNAKKSRHRSEEKEGATVPSMGAVSPAGMLNTTSCSQPIQIQ